MKPVISAYHPGEIEVQRRAGVRDEADEVGAIIGGRIPPAFVPLLAGFRIAVAASIDGRGRVWASLLTGPPGFLKATGDMRLRIEARSAPGDPLEANLAARPELGLLAFDPATRRRMRFNGKGVLGRSGSITLDVEQAYGNCRKYIQVRHLQMRHLDEEARPQTAAPAPGAGGTLAAVPARPAPVRSTALSARQQDRIGAADTFFIASAHTEGGADASHRGGRPGFVRVEGDRKLSFPDYPGNNMFNTLGNLTADPRAGLLFVDFESGDLLQLTGRARLVWDPETVAAHRGAQHVVVEFEIDAVLETPAASPLRWTFVEASPFNP
jgi:predicted pyridoxine 5'-phosphate oxidase superfamily flavin-nucleotide-binding protein